MRHINKRALRPTPALVVAFVALFAAMGGFGYAAVKMKPNSVRSKNIRNGAVTTDKIADGAVTTPKLAPDAVAPNATNAAYAMNAARLGGAAPGECQTGWLKASLRVDTAPLNGTMGQPNRFPASTAPARPPTQCGSSGKRSASTPSPWLEMTAIWRSPRAPAPTPSRGPDSEGMANSSSRSGTTVMPPLLTARRSR